MTGLCKVGIRSGLALAGLAALLVVTSAASAPAQKAPRYKLDPLWPKTLPNNWITGDFPALRIDKNDHIWVVHRANSISRRDVGAALSPPIAECCFPAPPVLEFDTEGNLLRSWGGRAASPEWPVLEQGFYVDKAGNIWIGGGFDGGEDPKAIANLTGWVGPKPAQLFGDRHVLKFSPDGKQLLRIGRPANGPANNQDTSLVGLASDIHVDEAAHEVYLADGVLNRRVVVYDSETGAFKRGWGAYGIPLSQIGNGKVEPYNPDAPPSKQFGDTITSLDISTDGLVYVCDRRQDRLQVFQKDGKFVKEFLIHPKTLDLGSCWSTAFSQDAKQQYLYVVDGANGAIWILNRDDGKEVGRIGQKGRMVGQFDEIKRIAFDSKGNLYTTEVIPNTRIQKFVLEK
jgi:hypothetical protein